MKVSAGMLMTLLAISTATGLVGALSTASRASTSSTSNSLDDDGSLWTEPGGLRYTNRKAMQVGDLITVIVFEQSQGSNSSSLRAKKEHKFDAEAETSTGLLKILPEFGASTSTKNEATGSGAVSLSGQLSTKLTARVIEILPDGHLVIEGSRLVEVNGEEDRLTLHGVARPEDIQADNTILSTYLAEARIAYAGNGAVHRTGRPGLFHRVLSWIF